MGPLPNPAPNQRAGTRYVVGPRQCGRPVSQHVRPQVSVRIRPAAQADAEDVAKVLIESRRAFLPFAPSAHEPANVRRWVATRLIPSGGVTVAEIEGRVAAVMATSHDGTASWIDQLYVLPAHVGRGIGSCLLASAHADLRPPIRLYTFQANSGARRFYERHGYEAIEFTDGSCNEERCPDVLYEFRPGPAA
ncbi:MAG: GNAT family N-acetyltransferase [Burkholderiales bacterium]